MKKYCRLLGLGLAFLGIIGLVGCGKQDSVKDNNSNNKTTEKKEEKSEEELNVFAAASLKISLEKIIKLYNEENPQVKINLVTNGSDKLFNQIKEGADADIFISASKKWMDKAVEDGLVSEKDSQPLLNNKVVLIKNINAEDTKLNDINDGKDLCLGAESVPVGGYSKKYFESVGKWDAIKTEASFEQQVTDVVKKVADGARKYGLVYQTDANSEIKNKTIAVCDSVPEDSGIKVIYPIGITKNAKNRDLAIKFSEYIKKGKARDILEDVGFVFVE